MKWLLLAQLLFVALPVMMVAVRVVVEEVVVVMVFCVS